MAAPTTLHKFTLLPPELRNIIWESSLPESRVFDIYPASTSQKTPAQQGLRFANLCTEPPPALAAVCRESRSLALHHYRPLTLGDTTKYVDLSRDVLLLESCLFERNLLRTLLFMGRIPLIRENLRALAFGTSYGVHTGVWHPVLGWKKPTRNNMGRFLQRLGVFPRLEKLVFVVHQEVQFEVSELPSLADMVVEASCAWEGQVLRNAAIYLKGTPPPPLRTRTLRTGGRGGEEATTAPPTPCVHDGLSRASTPGSSVSSESSFTSSSSSSSSLEGNEPNFYRMAWTSERPWLPHVNEISYYTQDESEDNDDVQDDDNDDDGNGDDDAAAPKPPATAGSRTRGLAPTNDDWLHFRRTLKRDLETGLELGLADATMRMGPCRKKRKVGADDVDAPSKRLRKTGAPAEGYKVLAIEGASLLWRYSLPNPL